jgi:hypothetical protein
MKLYGGADIAKLEIRINVAMYQLCVSEEVTWNVTEHLRDGINGKYAVNEAVTEHCQLQVST